MKRNKLCTLKTIIGILAREVGWRWFIVLWKCLRDKNKIMTNASWPTNNNRENTYIEDLAMAAALYTTLKRNYNQDHAALIMKKIIIPLGCGELSRTLEKINNFKTEPLERLIAFTEKMNKEGISQFNEMQEISRTRQCYHFVVRRCIIHDFLQKAGVPELSRIFCAVDEEFLPKAFPEFIFHRGSSFENTIGFGKEKCEFVFEKQTQDSDGA